MYNKTINRNHKDRLFRLIFQEKAELLSLYNAINGTSYTDTESLTVNTLDNSIYMGMKNDISFLVYGILSLYEHQSTWNPNSSGNCVLQWDNSPAGATNFKAV